MPTEIKQMIIKLAKAQDEAYKTRTTGKFEKERTIALNGSRPFAGRSVAALSLLNRDWHDLTLPALFKVRHLQSPLRCFRS